ncbi:MAG: TetR/AcrR family transcriptional regulator [Deltaproteobacteria bacterium]|nr:TetR/AcrR family transcriptional regulator [Deltaproteobacteria bacterium]
MSSSGIVSDPLRSPGPGREEKKAEVRRRILEASKEIFFRDGFMDANLDEIAELAGVAKGTLYRYFDNKAQIYLAVLSRKARRFEKKLQDSLDPQATPVDALVRVSRFYFQHYVENPDYFTAARSRGGGGSALGGESRNPGRNHRTRHRAGRVRPL